MRKVIVNSPFLGGEDFYCGTIGVIIIKSNFIILLSEECIVDWFVVNKRHIEYKKIIDLLKKKDILSL